jgi:two-component system NtrC family sensor kinase
MPYFSMKKSTFKIRRKIIRAFLFCVLAVLVFAVLSLQAHLEIGHRLKLVEVSDDLVNNILEIRRFEKNFFLYHISSNLSQALFYVNRVEGLLLEHEKEISNGDRILQGNAFLKKLHQYRETFMKIESLLAQSGSGSESVPVLAAERSLRNLGQDILFMAEGWRQEERSAIERLYRKAVYLFILSIGGFLVLGLLMASYLSRQLVRPLVQMQEAMSKIAEGDFTPIPETQSRSEEFRPLFSAFNRMIHELEARQEQLVQSRKIAAVGTLTSGIAHELNNPINNIVLSAEALKEGFGQLTAQEAMEMIEDILAQSDKASEIVKSLLDFSRSERPEFEYLSIAQVIEDTLKLVRNQMSLSHIRCETDLPPGLPPVYGDTKSLQQVFLNLFINAIQAMLDGGTLAIHASASGDGQWIAVEVSDSGVGIDPRDLPHIFDPFFTTKEVGKGTGLGLSVSYGILQKHGGQITARSREGKGTTFTVTLPVQEKGKV